MQELPRHRGCAALMSHSQPNIWRKIQKNCGDISPASLAFTKYAFDIHPRLSAFSIIEVMFGGGAN